MDDQEREAERQRRITEITGLLKGVRTQEDFEGVSRLATDYDLDFYGKRKGRACHNRRFDFRQHPHRPHHAYYLIDDGQSTGTCRWDNLYKVLTVA